MNGEPSAATGSPTGEVVIQEVATDRGPVLVRVEAATASPEEPALGPSIGEYPVYDDALYATMTQDDARNERFRHALSALCPGRRVLDVGTGADLNWALESLRCGAGSVDAVEAMEQSYRAAGQKLAALELDNPVTLHLGLSTELMLPQPAEVCVGEIIGSIAGAEGGAAVMTDVRARLLVNGGAVIPHRAATLAAGVSLRAVLGGKPVAFAARWFPYLSGVFDAAGGPHDVRLRVTNPASEALVTAGAEVEILEFNGDLRTDQEHAVELVVDRAGVLDGVLTWLRLWCTDGEEPLDALRTRTNWASVYFPLFDEEIPVTPGDRLAVRFRTVLSDDGIHPDYHLSAELRTSGGTRFGEHVSRHHGSEFRGSSAHRVLFPEG